jgi:hypothetical protein
MVSMTNGSEIKEWIEISKGWDIHAYLSTEYLGKLTQGMTSKGMRVRKRSIDIIRDTVNNRRDALRELAKY